MRQPETTLVLPEPPGQVEISGRAVEFPQNIGAAGATLEVWEIDSKTGARKDSEPHATLTVARRRQLGPRAGQRAAALRALRDPRGLPRTHHFYFQPWLRSSALVRMNLAPPNSQIVANTNLSDNHTAATIVRQKEWWTTHPTGQNDVLAIGTQSAEPRRPAGRQRPHESDEQRRDRHPRPRRGGVAW